MIRTELYSLYKIVLSLILEMCWLGSFALLTFFMVTTSGQVVHDCAAVQLNKPNAEQISFDLQEKKKDVEVKVR